MKGKILSKIQRICLHVWVICDNCTRYVMPFVLYCYLVKFFPFLFLFLYYQFGEIKLYVHKIRVRKMTNFVYQFSIMSPVPKFIVRNYFFRHKIVHCVVGIGFC